MTRRAVAVIAALMVAGCGDDDKERRDEQRLPRDVAAEERAGDGAPVGVGELPRDGAITVGGVKLPAGGRFKGVLWATDEPPPRPAKLWARLAARFEETGLWPLLLEVPAEEFELDIGYDWRPAARRDPEAVLRRQWSDAQPEPAYADIVGPFGERFPGVGRGGRPARRSAASAARLMEDVASLALVPVERPTEAPAAIGWTGPVNWYDDPAATSAILRGWEERYGAQVAGLGFDTLYAAVRRPPRGRDALLAAAEHYAFCPDVVQQGHESIRRLARELDGAKAWAFWWD